jgi:peptide/nickel transport system substrate-binding protein
VANEPLLPSHILQGKDRSAATKDGYTFSDGPWMLDHWTKGVEMKLVPNPMWFGHHPNLNSITFKFITDTAAEQQAVKSGQVLAAYPQAQPGQETLKAVPGIMVDAIPALSYEGIWFNMAKPPLDSVKVRQALAYATDRPAIVQQLFGAIAPDLKPIQSWYSPSYGAAYTQDFAKYKVDLNQVTSLMTSDGWTKGGDGIWAKGGQKANLELKTTTGNKRRLLTAQILQSEWKAAGFNLTLTTEKAGILFGNDLPAGNFQIGLYYQNPSDNDPGQCVIWCSVNIPTAANGQSGENYDRLNDPTIDKLATDMDSNLNQATRISEAQQVQARLAEVVPALPIDPPPDILVVNTDKVGTETGTFRHNLSTGPFVYADQWYLK